MMSDARICKLGLAVFLLTWGIHGWMTGAEAHWAGEIGYYIHIGQTFLGLFILAHEMKMKR